MKTQPKTIKQPRDQRTDINWTPTLAIGIAERFEPNDDPMAEIEAWSVIGINGLHLTLQGFFGRALRDLVRQDFLFPSYEINWEQVDHFLEYSYDQEWKKNQA